MNFRRVGIVLWTISHPLVIEETNAIIVKVKLPIHALNRIKVHSLGEVVHLKYQGEEKEIHLLPFLPDYYSSLTEQTNYMDLVKQFTEDIASEYSRDKKLWILATSNENEVIEERLLRKGFEVYRHQLRDDDITCTLTFPISEKMCA